MPTLNDLNKKCCLTCQHFQGERKLVPIGYGKARIETNDYLGICSLTNSKRNWTAPPSSVKCIYARWVELP